MAVMLVIFVVLWVRCGEFDGIVAWWMCYGYGGSVALVVDCYAVRGKCVVW